MGPYLDLGLVPTRLYRSLSALYFLLPVCDVTLVYAEISQSLISCRPRQRNTLRLYARVLV